MNSSLAVASAVAGWTAICVGAGGCSQPANEDEVVETEHLLISSPEPLCTLTVDTLELEAQRVAEETALSWLHPLPVKLIATDTPTEGCGDASGCTTGTGASVEVEAIPSSAPHEFVHAIRRQHELGTSAFLEEGYAEFVGSYDFNPKEVLLMDKSPSIAESMEDLNASPDNSMYLLGFHFFMWLEEVAGLDAIASWMLEVEQDVAAQTSSHFGSSPEDLAQAWVQTSAESYQRGDRCTDWYELDDGPIAWESELSCAGGNLHGPTLGIAYPYRSGSSMCFSLETEELLRVKVEGEGSFYRRAEDCNWDEASGEGLADTLLEPGEHELPFAPCTWSVRHVGDAREPGQVRIEFERPG